MNNTRQNLTRKRLKCVKYCSAYRHYCIYINKRIRWQTRFQKRKFLFDIINFLNKNMLIEDAKVKELVYSGNTVIFSLPNRECMRENRFFWSPEQQFDRLQRLQNQCARILTKSPRREHITPVLKSLHWLKIQDRITYKILMLTYKSYYNIAPTYLCELISRRESSVNTRLGSDQHQLIMPPISKDCSNTFLLCSFMPLYVNGTN